MEHPLVFPLVFENESVGVVRINEDGTIDVSVADTGTPKAIEAQKILREPYPMKYSFTLYRSEPPRVPERKILPFEVNGQVIGSVDIFDGVITSLEYNDTPLAKEVLNAFGASSNVEPLSLLDWESEIDKWRRAWLKDLPEPKLDKKKIRWPKKIF